MVVENRVESLFQGAKRLGKKIAKNRKVVVQQRRVEPLPGCRRFNETRVRGSEDSSKVDA